MLAHTATAQVSVPFSDDFGPDAGDFPGYSDPNFTTSATENITGDVWTVVAPGIASDDASQGYESIIANNSSTVYNCAEVQTTSLPAPQAFVISSDFQIAQFLTTREAYIGLMAFGNHSDLGRVGNGAGYGSFIWGDMQLSTTLHNGTGSVGFVNFENGSGGSTGISQGSQIGASLPINTNDTYHMTMAVTYDYNTNVDLTLTVTDVNSNLTASKSETITYASASTWFLPLVNTNAPNNGEYFGYCDREDANGLGGPGPYQTNNVLHDNFNLVFTNNASGLGEPNPVIITLSPYANRFVGASATFSASFSGVTPINYTWQYGGTNLSKTNNVSVTSTNGTNLVLNDLQLTNTGYYRLYASNSLGASNTAWTYLTVLPDPATQMIDVQIRDGYAGGYAYQGPGLIGTPADLWNYIDGSTNSSSTNIALFDSTGAATSVTMSFTPGSANFINSSAVVPLFTQFNQTTNTNTVVLSGLKPSTAYNLVVYAIGNGYQGAVVSGAVNGTSTGGPALVSDTAGFTNGVNYLQNTQALSDGTGSLTFNISPIPSETYGVWNGLQITQSSTQAPTLSIQAISGGQVKITWSSGTLLQSSSVTGPWTTNNATSPYVFTPSVTQQYFVVQGQ